MWNNVDNIPPFIPQAAHGRSGNVTFPADSVNMPAPVHAGRKTGPAPVYAGTPVPAGRQNRPAPVHADRPFPASRRNSVSVSAGWRNNAARPMSRPTSSYFHNYSRPVYYDQENPLKNKDLGIVDSGCSRSMSGNKERLDDFVEIKDASFMWVVSHFSSVIDGQCGLLLMIKTSFWYALTHDPIIFDSLVKQFWSTASLRAPELGPPAILAMIDRTPYTITEDTHCLSTKTGSWDQFGSSLAIALICLSDGRRFLQIILGIETRNPKQYHVLKLSSKLFANMRLNFEGDHMPLLAAMLPPAQAAIADDGTGEAALDGHTSDPNIVSFSGAYESGPDLFTSTNVEDETLGGSFHTTLPRSTKVPPVGPTSGGAEDLAKLTALSSLVSELVQKVNTLETELTAHKLLFKDVVGQLVKKVKALELKLKTRSRKVVMSESDKEDEEEQDVDPLIKLANVAAASDAHVGVSTGAPTGPSIVSPGSTTVPTSSSVPAAETILVGSGTTPESPSSSVRDARKGKGVAVDEPTPTHDKTFRQLEEERLGWEAAQRLQAQELADFEKQRAVSLMKDANLAKQMSQDFEMTEDQRNRQQDVLASSVNYSDAAWDIILARLQENRDLTSVIFGVEFTDDDFAAMMVELVNTRRKELAEQRAQERRERPMTPSQLRQYMRTYLQEEFNRIQRAVAFTRGLKRDGSPMTSASSKKLKTGVDDVNFEAPSHSVPQEEEGATPSQNVSREEVATPSHSQDIPDAQVEVPSQKATIEDVEYASDADSASDDDTPVNFYAIVDWELLPTGLGSINAFYRKDNSLGNELTTAVQLIAFLKKQISDSRRPKVHDWYC
ncbi:hypothetical protein Tco_1404143 [Tanacetum coccineum]